MPRHGDDHGAVAVVVAAFSRVMFAFAAIVVDLGVARSSRTDAQTAADAAAFSGVGALYVGQSMTADVPGAVSAVKESAYENYLRFFYSSRSAADTAWGASASGTMPGAACAAVVPPGWSQLGSGTNCILFRPATDPREMRVVVPSERSPAYFGGLLGYGGLTISGTTAEAEVPDTTRLVRVPPSCVVCLLGPGPHVLQNGDLNVTGGDVWFNGGLELEGNGAVNASPSTVHVQESIPANRRDQVTNPKVSPTTVAPNPPFVAMPDVSSLPKRSDPCVSGPGRYGGLLLGAAQSCTLSPGTYVFTDPITLSGTARFTGSGVTVYLACGTNGGDLKPCGADTDRPSLVKELGAQIVLTAPTTGAMQGLAILYDDGLTATWDLGNVAAGDFVTGTVYGRELTLDATGYDCEGSFRSMLVVRTMSMQDQKTCFATTYSEAENVAGPTVSVPALDVPVLSR